MASLNRENVQAYFNGVDKILNELDETKNDLEVNLYIFKSILIIFKAEEQLRLERLVEAKELCATLRNELDQMRKKIVSEVETYNSNKSSVLKRIEKVRTKK